MPDDLRTQIAPIHEIVEAMGLPLLVIDGVEADDVIGTLAEQASKVGIDTVISTGDKDMAQLVNKHVTLINTMTDVKMDVAGVIEKFGVRPDQIIDYLALMGDKVDNIPGVNKCGPKTAVKWLLEHENLDNVMANADNVKGKIGEYLREALEFLPLSYELATIKLDVPLEQTADQLQPSEVNIEKLTELYTKYELRRLLADIQKGGSASDSSSAKENSSSEAIEEDIPAADDIETDYQIIFNKADFTLWLAKLKSADLFAFDTETTSVDYMKAELVGLSFSVEAGTAAYVPLKHDYEDAPQQLDSDWVLAQLKPLLEDKNQAKVGQKLKYDANVL
jgi:DNA polymerase-1